MISSAMHGLRKLLLPRPEAGTRDTHATQRSRRAFKSGSAAALARIVQIGTSLVTVPLTLKYLGNERFGLWMTISSLLAMASFADFGVGNGVLSSVATSFGRDDMAAVRKAVSSGFAVLNTIALILLVVFLIIFPFVSWADFFGVSAPNARAEAGPALMVFATCFALNISLDVVQRVQLGLQQGYRCGLWQLCGSVMGFIGVIVGIWLRVNLPTLVVAIAGAPVLATALNFLHFFGFVRADLRPSLRDVSRQAISQISRLGGLFFVLQMVVAASFSADNFIIARTLGAIDVPDYAIPQRMFAVVTIMLSLLTAPLWPAYGEAISRGDLNWVRRTLKKSLLIVLCVATLVAALLLLLSHWIILFWVGPQIHAQPLLLLGIALWTVVNCCGEALGAFLNGVSAIRVQVLVAVAFGFACLATKVVFIRLFGITGIPWATLLTYLVVNVLPYTWYVPILLKRLGSNINATCVDSGAEDVPHLPTP